MGSHAKKSAHHIFRSRNITKNEMWAGLVKSVPGPCRVLGRYVISHYIKIH